MNRRIMWYVSTVLGSSLLGLLGGLLFPMNAFAQSGGGTQYSLGSDDISALVSALKARGWRVERNPNGDVVLQRVPVAPDSELGPPASLPERTSRPVSTGVGTGVGTGEASTLQDALATRGWQVSRDADGSLVLRPHGDAGADSAVSRGAPGSASTSSGPERGLSQQTTISQASATGSGFEGLARALSAAGWQVDSRAEGGLELRWSGKHPSSTAKTGVDDRRLDTGISVPGYDVSDALRPGVGLPLRSRHDARRVAEAWLRAVEPEPLVVGRVRDAVRLYIVSIVRAEPPHRLYDQVVIRKRDALVISTR